MFSIIQKIVIFFIISLLLTACGAGVSGVDNNHPSQFSPQTAPKIEIEHNNKNQLLIDWPKQENSQAYTLFLSTSEGFEVDRTEIVTVQEPPYTILGLEPGQSYFVKVLPFWLDKVGPESASISFISPSEAPKNVKIDENSLITWDSLGSSFNVYWSIQSDFTIETAENSFTGLTDKKFQPKDNNYQNDDILYFLITNVTNTAESEVSEKVEIPAAQLIVISESPKSGHNNNQTPTLENPILDQQVEEDSLFQFQFSSQVFNDEVVDKLIYRVSDLPGWLMFNVNERSFTGTPLNKDVGSYDIKLIATDAEGESASTVFTLSVNNTNDTPIAGIISPQSTVALSNFNYQFLENVFSDEDIGDSLVFSTSSLPSWLNFSSLTRAFSGIPAVKDIGILNISITATDNSNASVGVNFKLTIESPVKPSAIDDKPDAVLEGGTINIGILENDVSAANTNLLFSSVNIMTNTLNGSTKINDDGSILYQHNGDESVTDMFTYQVSDTIGNVSNTAQVTIIITPVNDLPIANDDNAIFILSTGSKLIIDVLNNDVDAENDLNTESITIIDQGGNGIATADNRGVIFYQSNPGTIADDSFTYTIKDKNGAESNVATVFIVDTLWKQTDIGNIGLLSVPESIITNNNITISGSGFDIWNTEDAFHYFYKEISGDLDFSVRVVSLQNPQKWMKAGIMIREALTPNSKDVNFFTTDFSKIPFKNRGPHLNVRFEENEITYDLSNRFNRIGNGTPRFLRLIRRGDTFNTFESTDGKAWLLTGSANVPMTQSVYAGLAVTSTAFEVLISAVFDNLSIKNESGAKPEMIIISAIIDSSTKTFSIRNQAVNQGNAYYSINTLTPGASYNVEIIPSNGGDLNLQVYRDAFDTIECQSFKFDLAFDSCLATASSSGELFVHIDGSYATDAMFTLKFTQWESQDIVTQISGGFLETDAIQPFQDEYLITGAGRDIAAKSDAFRYFYQPISGDVEIIVHITSQENTAGWAKAGVMIREKIDVLTGFSRFVDVVMTPENGVRFQARTDTAQQFVHFNTRVNEVVTTRWVKLNRRGSAFDAYESKNGVNWLFLGTANVPNMAKDVFVGLAVTATDKLGENKTSSATFESIQVDNGVRTGPDIESIQFSFIPTTLQVNTTDKFVKFTGLTPMSLHTVNMSNLQDDADLYIYSDDSFSTILCPTAGVTPINETGSESESCQSTSNAAGEIFVRINGSYTKNGSSFDLLVN